MGVGKCSSVFIQVKKHQLDQRLLLRKWSQNHGHGAGVFFFFFVNNGGGGYVNSVEFLLFV